MLATVAAAVHARLVGTGVFRAVEQAAMPRTHAQLPAAVHYLAEDNTVTDSPQTVRQLVWMVAILAPAMSADKGSATAMACVDAVREAFSGWTPFSAGALPAVVKSTVFTDLEDAMLLYHTSISLRVFPSIFAP